MPFFVCLLFFSFLLVGHHAYPIPPPLNLCPSHPASYTSSHPTAHRGRFSSLNSWRPASPALYRVLKPKPEIMVAPFSSHKTQSLCPASPSVPVLAVSPALAPPSVPISKGMCAIRKKRAELRNGRQLPCVLTDKEKNSSLSLSLLRLRISRKQRRPPLLFLPRAESRIGDALFLLGSSR